MAGTTTKPMVEAVRFACALIGVRWRVEHGKVVPNARS